MVERFLSQTSFVSQEDYRKNLHIRVPENFNFGYDVVDAYAAEQPGKEALLHISEIDWKRFETMEESGLKEGEMIDVKLIGVDEKTGKLKLSHRALLPKPEGYVERERRPRGDRERRRDDRHRD